MSTKIEEEIHFLFYYSKYSTLRETFFNQIYLGLPNVRHTITTETLKILMNFLQLFIVNLLLIKLISSCFVIRDTELNIIKSKCFILIVFVIIHLIIVKNKLLQYCYHYDHANKAIIVVVI